jgi:hypothetical protein
MLPPNWLLENPFRILRLSANATSADAHKAASTMRRMAVLNAATLTESDLPSLGPLPRSETSIRSSLGRIESPALRIFDRLFWFHNTNSDDTVPSSDDPRAPLRHIAARHDDALHALLRLYQAERIPENPESWSSAFRIWHTVVLSGDYWRLSKTLDEFGSFEPPATEREFEALRQSAMLRAAEPLLSASREALIGQDEDALKAAVRILLALSDTGDWVHTARAEIFEPFTEAIDRACKENREIFGVKVIRTDESAQANIQPCNDMLQHFREAVQPSLGRLQRVAERDQSEERTARENVARCLSSIGGAFTWSDRYVESEALFREALSLAEGTIAAVEIERSVQDNKGAADKERRLAGLSADLLVKIQTARSHAIVILSTGRASLVREQDMAAHNKPICDVMLGRFRTELQPMIKSAMSALPPQHPLNSELLADEALCLNSIATDYTWADEFVVSLQLRQEALVIAANTDAVASISEGISNISESARQERFLKELIPLKGTPALSTLNGIGGKLYGSSDHDPSTNSFATTYYFTFLYFPVIPLRRYRVIQDGKSYRFLGRLPFRKFDKWHLGIVLIAILIAIIVGASSSSTATGSVPLDQTQTAPTSSSTDNSSTGQDSQQLKAEIDGGRARMKALDSELDPIFSQMKQLKSEIDQLNSELKALDSEKATGTDIDTAGYNAKVNRYNDLVSRRKALYAEHSESIEEYQALAKKDDDLVARYNASLK